MTADQDQTQTRRRRLGRVVEGATCACDRDRMCLWHYDELDPGRQTRERARTDVREPYIGGRRH
jgi:hypothetical protein